MNILQSSESAPQSIQTRRRFLLQSAGGFGAAAFQGLIGSDSSLANDSIRTKNPLSAKTPHFPATAKSVIFLFMQGGPSHIDLFDPKPVLQQLAGKPLPTSFKRPVTAMGEINSPLLESKRKWKQHGEGGTWVSDWLPHVCDMC